MNYLLINEKRYNLTDDGININDGLKLTVKADDKAFEDIREAFKNLEGITVYGCIAQEDGSKADEFVAAYYDEYTKFSKIEYNLDSDTYTVTLIVPNEVEARLSELEDAVNFLVMGGEE